MKRTKVWTTGMLAACVMGAGTAIPAHAQNDISVTNGKFFIDLRDASLANALELLFRAAGNPAHSIDPSAQDVNIGPTTFPNTTFENALLQLTRLNVFKVVRENGIYNITPREPVEDTSGGSGGGGRDARGGGRGGSGDARGGSGRGGSAARGGSARGGTDPRGGGGTNASDAGAVPDNPLDGGTMMDRQTRPFGGIGGGVGGGGGIGTGGIGGFGGNGNSIGNRPNTKPVYRRLTTRHITARAVASIFPQGGVVITTEQFLGFGVIGGGGGGFGNNNVSSFGGGGNNGGGFGGGGNNGGGFGGGGNNGGGFGGGGFGGGNNNNNGNNGNF